MLEAFFPFPFQGLFMTTIFKGYFYPGDLLHSGVTNIDLTEDNFILVLYKGHILPKVEALVYQFYVPEKSALTLTGTKFHAV